MTETALIDEQATTLDVSPVLAELNSAIDKLNATTLKDAYASLGIEPPQDDRAVSWESTEYRVANDLTVLAATRNGTRKVYAEGQRELGQPGTYIIDGRIEVEHNSRVKPFQARGRLGRPGLNEEVYRTEPVAFKSINEISALGCAAVHAPIIGDNTPAAVVDEIKRQDRAIQRALFAGDVLDNAMFGLLKHGFSFFEVGWGGLKEQRPKVGYIEFREQASVERWIFDERQNRHVGTEFRTTSFPGAHSRLVKSEPQPNDPTHYIIPNGSTLRTARTMLVNVFATGNNLEGVSPIRVITGLRKLKELVLAAFGVGYQKYAVPIATIVQELTDAAANAIQQMGAAAHGAEIQTLLTRLKNIRGRLGAVLPIPAGHRLEFQNPSNEMPDVTPILEYIDGMIALVFSNEGALLGMQSFGSYAMSQTSDAKFYRASVVYSARIARALTKLLHTALELNGIDLDELDELPRYGFRFNGTQDASRWLADLVMTMNAKPQQWPEEIRHAAADKFGFKRTAFDDLGTIYNDTPAPSVTGGEEE